MRPVRTDRRCAREVVSKGISSGVEAEDLYSTRNPVIITGNPCGYVEDKPGFNQNNIQMKQRNNLWTGAVLTLLLVVMSACNNEQSLQRYYVDSAEKEGFISLDIPSNMLNISNADLTEEQK